MATGGLFRFPEMAKLILLLCALLFLTSLPTSEAQKSAIIKLTFYEHNFIYGPNVSSVQTGIVGTGQNPLVTGTISVYNNQVTTGVNLNSKLLGFSKGTQIVTNILPQSENIQVYVVQLKYGRYQGILSLLGYINNDGGGVPQPIPIVGGTGAFLFTTGVAKIQVASFNPKTGELVYKYDVVLKKL